MGIFSFFTGNNQKHPTPSESISYGRRDIIDSLISGPKNISEEEALKIPALASGINLIANSIGQLNFTLIKKDGKTGAVIRKNDDKRLYLLNKQPNETMDAYTFKRALAKDYLLYGASNSVIERNLNEIKGLYLLPSNKITVEVYVKDGYHKYSKTILNSVGGNRTFDDYELLTVLKDSNNGLTGKGILETNTEVLKLALAELKYSESILKNGALPVGALESASKLSDKAFENLKTSWANLYQGAEKAGKTVLLEEGLKYTPISLNPNDLQLSEIRKAYISDIARILNIPESMINPDANKYASGEMQSIAFLQNCLSSVISSIENAVNKELLLESEKIEGYQFKLDPTKLIQLTRKEKAEAVEVEFKAGLISFWEARSDLDRSKKLDEDYLSLSLGTVLYKYGKDEMVIPNTMQSKAVLENQKQQEGG